MGMLMRWPMRGAMGRSSNQESSVDRRVRTFNNKGQSAVFKVGVAASGLMAKSPFL
jgi:hypothetical protein